MSWKKLVFNVLGISGLLMATLFIFLNKFASSENILHEYRLKIVLVFAIVLLVHYCMLGADAIKRKKYGWAVALFIAPIPTYWIYYGYYTFFLNKSVFDSPVD